jgi:hypothetical protein
LSWRSVDSTFIARPSWSMRELDPARAELLGKRPAEDIDGALGHRVIGGNATASSLPQPR